jgi:hypothetical protein
MTFFAVAACLSFEEPSKAAKDLLVSELPRRPTPRREDCGFGGEVAAGDFAGAEEFGGEFLFHGRRVVLLVLEKAACLTE